MSRKILFAALLALTACGANDTATKAGPAGADSTEEAAAPVGPEIRRAAEALPALYAWMARQDSAFRPEAFEAFSPVDADTLPAQPMPAAELARWKPYLLYNADSSLALDLYSS
ncbi:MAG: hypothetical protein EOO11_20340, partial [Chitinophagaceae bacterium]